MTKTDLGLSPASLQTFLSAVIVIPLRGYRRFVSALINTVVLVRGSFPKPKPPSINVLKVGLG